MAEVIEVEDSPLGELAQAGRWRELKNIGRRKMIGGFALVSLFAAQ